MGPQIRRENNTKLKILKQTQVPKNVQMHKTTNLRSNIFTLRPSNTMNLLGDSWKQAWRNQRIGHESGTKPKTNNNATTKKIENI